MLSFLAVSPSQLITLFLDYDSINNCLEQIIGRLAKWEAFISSNVAKGLSLRINRLHTSFFGIVK